MRTALALCLAATPALADPAEIVGAEATRTGETWRIAVTLRHGDTGWDDYADGWRVEDADGTVLATRELLHPTWTNSPSPAPHPASRSQTARRRSSSAPAR